MVDEVVHLPAELPDPAAGLPPAAGRVLRAALALLDDTGPQALTAEALARKSGEPSSSVFYYFGDKHGLLTAVLTAGQYRFVQGLTRAARPAVARPTGAASTADVLARLFGRPGWMRTFYDLLPLILRDGELTTLQAESTAHVRGSIAAYLRRSGVSSRDASALAALCLALMHGLAIQRLVDRSGTPVAEVVDLWRALLSGIDERHGGVSSDA